MFARVMMIIFNQIEEKLPTLLTKSPTLIIYCLAEVQHAKQIKFNPFLDLVLRTLNHKFKCER